MEEIVFSELYPEVSEELSALKREVGNKLNKKCWFQTNRVVVTVLSEKHNRLEPEHQMNRHLHLRSTMIYRVRLR